MFSHFFPTPPPPTFFLPAATQVTALHSAASAFRASTSAHVADELAAAAAAFDAARAAQQSEIDRLHTAASEQAALLAAIREEQSETERRARQWRDETQAPCGSDGEAIESHQPIAQQLQMVMHFPPPHTCENHFRVEYSAKLLPRTV